MASNTMLRGDLFGLTRIMLIQGMARAMLADAWFMDLCSDTSLDDLCAIFGTSPQLALGPVALDVLLIASGLSLLLLWGWAILSVGDSLGFYGRNFSDLDGCLRLGFVVNFLSSPVVLDLWPQRLLLLSTAACVGVWHFRGVFTKCHAFSHGNEIHAHAILGLVSGFLFG